MSNDLLNLIPNDILNLIWIQITPNYKYFLNKYYFNKYYDYRFFTIHHKKLNNVLDLKISNYNNYSYYYYILTNDLIYFSKIILTLYITNNNSDSKYNKDKSMGEKNENN